MAERLKRIQPTSSIASALNLDAVRAATDPTSERHLATAVGATKSSEPEAPTVAPVHRSSVVAMQTGPWTEVPQRQSAPDPRPFGARRPTGERAEVMRQFQLTPSADAALQDVMSAYSRATCLELTRSEFLRSVLRAPPPTVLGR